MPRTQVNSATGIMGVTGSGKSTLIHTQAKYVWRRWKKITRYYTSDGGGFPAPIQQLQALGIMEVFRMRTRDNGDLAFETCYRACQGWWPRKIRPSTGEVPPAIEMVPPVALRFTMRCPQGHVVKVVPSQSLLVATICPECRKPVTTADMHVTKEVVVNQGFEHVGAVAFDGLSSMLSWEMMELGHRSGRLELRGEEAAIGGKVVSGDLKFGGTTRSHVGFAQTRGEELVHLTLGIPNLVVPPVFTMLTHEDVDDRSLNITGPKIAGRAKTDEAPQWFGNLLEAAKIPALEGTGEQRVLYLNEFTDATGRRHLCKNRAAPGDLPAMLMDPPNTDLPENAHLAFTGFNLGVFFELLDGALEKAIEAGKAEFPDAPGLPETEDWVEIGGASVQLPAQPTPAAPGLQTLNVPGGGAVATSAAPAAPRAPGGKKKAAAAQPPVLGPQVAGPPPPTPPEQFQTFQVRVQAAPAGNAAAPPAADVATDTPAPAEVSTSAATPAPTTPPAPPPVQAQVPPPASPRVAPPAGRRPVAGAAPPVGTPPGVSVTGPAIRPPAAAPRAPTATRKPAPSGAPPEASPIATPGEPPTTAH